MGRIANPPYLAALQAMARCSGAIAESAADAEARPDAFGHGFDGDRFCLDGAAPFIFQIQFYTFYVDRANPLHSRHS